MATRQLAKNRGSTIIVFSVLVGLVLACFTMISPHAGTLGLLCGIVLTLTVLLKRAEYLICAWFVLSTLLWLILLRLPPHYYEFVGRGIFWGLLLCAVAAWAMDIILRGRQFVSFDNVPLKATVLAFMLLAVMTLFTSTDVMNSVRKLLHIVIALLCSYMFYDLFSRDPRNVRIIVGIASLMLCVVSFVTVAISVHSLIIGIPIYKRITLWFLNPNILGGFVFTFAPIFITSGFYFIRVRWLKPVLISVVLFALLFSSSRTFWVAFLASVSFLLWKSRVRLGLAIGLIGVLFVSGLTIPLWRENVYNYITGPRYSGRIELWQAALSVAYEHPLLGVGMGNSIKSMRPYIETAWLFNQNSHSLYLQNVAELGFLSLPVLLTFYAVFLYSSFRIERDLTSTYLKLAVRGVIATFIGIFVHSIFGVGSLLCSFDAGEPQLLFPYILMGLPFAAKKLDEKTASDI